ncbi:MAG TPA: Gfo/Idh/MocA family oxidoreductase [Ignavibacteriaceae bacterium]|nr:Gfo/Idh/MocA family oxidoreductase [Ignavibacteriaceae bacterium]
MKKSLPKKLKWGVAGCGRYAENTFIPTMHMMRKSTVHSVFSGSNERAKAVAQKHAIPQYFSNYDDFLKSGIDAVYVSSANAHHYKQVIEAARAGKNILCEKPLALNPAEAEEMIRVCKENNVMLSVNYVFHFHPLVRKAKEIIENEMIGKIISISTNFNIEIAPSSNFRHLKSGGGGALMDVGTHMIDLLRFFGGEVSSVCGVMDSIVYNSEVDDFASAILKFENGGYGYFNVSFSSKRAFNRVEILGHKGAISIEKMIANRHSPSKLTILLDGEAKKSFRKRANKQLLLLKSLQRSFLRNEEPVVTGYDGLVNLKIMEELRKQCL